MNWLQLIVQWLHVLLGIVWLGTALTANFLLMPAIRNLPLEQQRDLTARFGAVASPVMSVVIPVLIGLGILRGTVFGPIQSLDVLFGTAYGITWMVALGTTLGTWAWGKFALEPALHRVSIAQINPDGTLSLAGQQALAQVKTVALLELIGFAVIFSCMILMRFGL